MARGASAGEGAAEFIMRRGVHERYSVRWFVGRLHALVHHVSRRARGRALAARGARLALDAAPSMSRLSERLAAWRVKPDAATEDALAAASAPGFFLVQRPGPSAFVVREEGRAGAPLRVLVGARQTCSCGGGMATRAWRSEARAPKTERLLRERNVAAPDDDDDASRVASVCAHIAFVMTRVLRVPRSNPLAWQLSLVDRELDETLRCELASGRARARGRTGDDARASRSLTALSREDEDENENKNHRRGDSRGRRDLGPDEPCPICYEPMDDVDDDPTSARDAANRTVVWCRGERRPKKTEEERRPPADANEPSSSLASKPPRRAGCGRGVHARCLAMFRDHGLSADPPRALTCPLCRCPWGELTWRPPPPRGARASRDPAARRDVEARSRRIHFGVSCRACRASPVVGWRFRCAVCVAYDLCAACHASGAHAAHPFVAVETPGGVETDASEAAAAEAESEAAEAAEDSVSAAEPTGRPRPRRAPSDEAAAVAPPETYPRPNRVVNRIANRVANGAARWGTGGARVNRGGRVASDAPLRGVEDSNDAGEALGVGFALVGVRIGGGARVDASTAERR